MSETGDLSRFDTLREIIARLRGPGGCPWDRAQTHQTLREHLLAECYEVLQTLDSKDTGKLGGELGDLLLQIMLHAEIARETGDFNIDDVIRELSEKLIYRHPHIFGGVEVAGPDEVAHNWEALKQARREEGVSMLASVPQHMPALAYSMDIQKRVSRVGFDWPDLGGVLAKLSEEVAELTSAADQEAREREFGDLLFTLVNLARHTGIDAETALRQANRRFYGRFTHMEELCKRGDKSLTQLSPAEMDALWEEAKKALG